MTRFAPSLPAVLALGAGLALAGCMDDAPISAPPDGVQAMQSVAPRDSTTQQKFANTIARSVALAMQQPPIRVAIRNAMRDSRFHEHKLHFRSFLESARGRKLLEASGAAVGLSGEEYFGLLDALPDFEFYLPEKEHRLAWRPDEPYFVTAVAQPNDFVDPVVTLYDGQGTPSAVDVVNAMPEKAVFVIVPVEADFSRPDVPARSYKGETVQSPGECHPLQAGCAPEGIWPESFAESIEPMNHGSGTQLARGILLEFELTRDRDGIGSNEIEFWYWMEGSAQDPGVFFAGDHDPEPHCIRFTGMDADGPEFRNIDLGDFYPTSNAELGSEFWEDDNGGCVLHTDSDDLIGRPDNFFQPDGGTSVAEARPSTWSLQPVQWEDNIGGSGPVTDGRVLFEIDHLLSASMSGPNQLDPHEFGTWTVSVSSGTGSYSYQWLKDGSPVGSNSPSYSTTAGNLDFEVFVRVTDLGTSAIATDRQHVEVCGGPGGPICPQ